MTRATPTAATDESFVVGEGPRWDAARGRLLWVDIPAGLVLEGHLDGARIEVTRRHHVDATVGAVAFTDDGDLVVAGRTGIVTVTDDGELHPGRQLIVDGAERRLNDAATDPAGRLLAGSLNLAGRSSRETLWQLTEAGTVVIDDDLTMSNGLAWSVDGTRLYSVDTLRRAVYVRDYDVASGAVGPRRTHLLLAQGNPDGIAVDSADHLWLAIWGEGEIRRYAPGGALADVVRVPAPLTSAVGFAGDDLRTLVITTASIELTGEQRQAFPDSGRLFTVRVDVPGQPTVAVSRPATVEVDQPCT